MEAKNSVRPPLGTIKQEFERFMSLTYPTVLRGSSQWEAMELVWNSASFMACGIMYEGGKERVREVAIEAKDFCYKALKNMKEAYQQGLDS